MADSHHVFDRPPPRTAHQACLHKQHLYVFGGELTSVNQAGVSFPSIGLAHELNQSETEASSALVGAPQAVSLLDSARVSFRLLHLSSLAV